MLPHTIVALSYIVQGNSTVLEGKEYTLMGIKKAKYKNTINLKVSV